MTTSDTSSVPTPNPAVPAAPAAAPAPPKSRDVTGLEEASQKKWLEQRGYIKLPRDGVELWRHPETGIRYVFAQAMKMALQDCRLPADYELKPELPKRSEF